MKVSEQKKIITDVLKLYFQEQGIQGIDIWALRYEFVLPKGSGELKCALSFSNYGDPPGFTYSLCIYPVEQIIMEIQFPNHDFSGYKKNETPFGTVISKGFTKLYTDKENKNNSDTETIESYVNFGNYIVRFLQNEGMQFTDEFNYLPNILKKMDELEALGLNWNNRDRGILAGTLDAYFRGLIISKLCNDADFERKVIKMDVKFVQTGYEEWVPYYERLKERLNTVTPVYNA